MTATEVSRLSLSEKFQLMEALWSDLRDRVATAPLPDHHKRLLDERRRRVESGESKLLDWEEVKDQIGRRG